MVKNIKAMGIPPAPPLANGWLSQYDPRIKGDAKLFSRYMDDIIRSIRMFQFTRRLIYAQNFYFLENISFLL